MTVKPTDDQFHPGTDHPYWNESSFLTCVIPELEINVMFYVWHRPNMNLTSTEVAVWDTSADHEYDCLYYERDQHQHLKPGSNMYEFKTRNSTHVRTLELGKRFGLGFNNHGCEIDTVWEAIAEPVASVGRSDGEINPIIAKWLVHDPALAHMPMGHFQQAARMSGTITLEGETFTFENAPAHRDHTWGPRHTTGDEPRGGWGWAVHSPDLHFCAPAVSAYPSDEDPMVDTVEPFRDGGWLVRDGKLGRFVEGERKVVERGDDGRPLLEIIDGTDEHGRTLHAEGRPLHHFNWIGFTDYYDWFCMTRWEFDGIEAIGQIHDYMPYRLRRRLTTNLGIQRPVAEILRDKQGIAA